MRLIEILGQLAEIESLLIENKGELTPEDDTKLKLFTESLVEKVDGYKHFFDRIDLSINYWKAKEHEAKQIRAALETGVDNAKEHLKATMLQREITTLEGDEYIFKISPTKGKLVITDEEQALAAYPKEKITITIDNEKIRQDLEANIDMKCAVIEQTWSLRTTVKRKK